MSMIKPSKAGERLGLLGLSETDMMSLSDNDLGKTKKMIAWDYCKY